MEKVASSILEKELQQQASNMTQSDIELDSWRLGKETTTNGHENTQNWAIQ